MEPATLEFEYPVEQWFTGQYSLIPERMQGALKRYVIDRIPPGDFLTAVITNDLRSAVQRADEENAKLLALYVRWFSNIPPAMCWGNHEAMRHWLHGSP